MKIKLKNLPVGSNFDYKGAQWILLNDSGLCIAQSNIYICSTDKSVVSKYLTLFSESLGHLLRLPTIKEFYKYDSIISGDSPYIVAIFDGPLVVTNGAELVVPEENTSYGLRPITTFDLDEEVTILRFDFDDSQKQAVNELDKLIETLTQLREEIGGSNNE